MLSVLNCFLLFQVILAIFVPYFYSRGNFGANLGVSMSSLVLACTSLHYLPFWV